MKKTLLWTLLLVLLLSVGCNDKKDDEPEPEHISLDTKKLTFGNDGGDAPLILTCNRSWAILDIPQWLSIDFKEGSGSKRLNVKVQANKDYEPREAVLRFVAGNQSVTIQVEQLAFVKPKAKWSNLGFSFFGKVDITELGNDAGYSGNFDVTNQFVNPSITPSITDDIFLGNLVNRKFKSNTQLEVYKGYTFVPITVFPLWGASSVKSKEITPSKKALDDYAQEIIRSKPKQNEAFFANNGKVYFNSYKQLNLLGKSNMGDDLEKIVSGKSYKEQKMAKKNGIIYSFSQTNFTISMDLQESVIQEKLQKKDFPENSLSYISAVSYGRVGLLVIETDYELDKAKIIVNRILGDINPSFSEEQIAIVNEMVVTHIYFDKDGKMKVVRGKTQDVVESYSKQVKNDLENIFLYRYQVSDFFDHGTGIMSYSLKVE